MPWNEGFPEDRDSYRSRARAKRRKELEEEARFSKLERKNEEIIDLFKQQQKQLDQMREQQAPTYQLQQDSDPSQWRSSVASTGVGADLSTGTYPVDDISEKTSCEPHVPIINLSLKVADGYALTCESTAVWHFKEIPDGYARVGVDRVRTGYESMVLEIPGGDDVTALGDVGGGIILWRKKYIVFPGLAPPRPPPSSPPRRDSPPPSPHDDHMDDEQHSTSPREPTPPPCQLTPPPCQPTPPPPPPTTQGQG